MTVMVMQWNTSVFHLLLVYSPGCTCLFINWKQSRMRYYILRPILFQVSLVLDLWFNSRLQFLFCFDTLKGQKKHEKVFFLLKGTGLLISPDLLKSVNHTHSSDASCDLDLWNYGLKTAKFSKATIKQQSTHPFYSEPESSFLPCHNKQNITNNFPKMHISNLHGF